MDERKRGMETNDGFVMSFWILFKRNWLKYLEISKISRLEFTWCNYLRQWNSDSLHDLPAFLSETSLIPRVRILMRWHLKKRTLRKSSHWLFLKCQHTNNIEVFTKLKLTGGTFLSMIVRKISIHWVIVWLFTNWSGNAYWNKKKKHSHEILIFSESGRCFYSS